ncbi:MAG: hypothetical protein RIC55_18050 [Pirellulaceae bacterium]
MLEILLIVGLCKGMGNLMRGKGRSPLLMQILVVVSWFGGEFCGIIGYMVFQSAQGYNAEPDLAGYGVAIGVAALGVGTTFLIASMIPAAAPQPQTVGAYGNYPQQMGPPTDPNNPYNPYSDPRQ